MVSRIITVVFIACAVSALAVVASFPGGGKNGRRDASLTPEQAESLYTCVYYPGQASDPETVRLLGEYSDAAVLARIESFEFGGFTSPEISWEVVLRTSHYLKGQGKPLYKLTITSPERNFGKSAEGRLFMLFVRESGGKFFWALEPWLPENENLISTD